MTGITRFVLYFLWFATSVYGRPREFELCRTPDGYSGECIPVLQCSAVVNLLQQQLLLNKTVDYLKKLQCGFEGIDAKVCCTLEDNEEIPTTQTAVAIQEIISNLLPDTRFCGMFSWGGPLGGQIAELNEFPWTALIKYQKPNGSTGFYCGGVLISTRYILTAAHCVKGRNLPKDWNLISVRLGEHNIDKDLDCDEIANMKYCADLPIDVLVMNQIVHEQYDPIDNSQHHDIALLRLDNDVNFTEFIKPICLPTSSEFLKKNFDGTYMTVAGWGITETGPEINLKLKTQVLVKPNNECSSIYGKTKGTIGENQLCAGGVKDKDFCKGDSGGSLMVENSDNGDNWYAAGIASFGPSPCGLNHWPEVYTRVSEYVPWISSKLKP